MLQNTINVIRIFSLQDGGQEEKENTKDKDSSSPTESVSSKFSCYVFPRLNNLKIVFCWEEKAVNVCTELFSLQFMLKAQLVTERIVF